MTMEKSCFVIADQAPAETMEAYRDGTELAPGKAERGYSFPRPCSFMQYVCGKEISERIPF